MSLRPPYALQRILHYDGILTAVKWTKWHLSLLYLLFFCEVQGNDFVCGLLERGGKVLDKCVVLDFKRLVVSLFFSFFKKVQVVS